MAKQLHAWARSPGQTIELLLQDGRRFSVIFRMGWAREAERVMGSFTGSRCG